VFFRFRCSDGPAGVPGTAAAVAAVNGACNRDA